MTDNNTILITGVGGGSLGREIMKSLRMTENNYKIIASDMSKNSIGLFDTKFRYIVPKASSSNYIETILKICKKEKVEVLIGGSEPEIEVIAKNKKIFSENGIKVLSNSWDIIKKSSDKFEVIQLLNSFGIKCPKTKIFQTNQDLKEFLSFPIIIKPRFGSGSKNVFIAYDLDDAIMFCTYLKKYGQEPLIQEHIGNFEEEYTIGVLFDDGGKLCTSIAMRRILEGGISTRQISVNPKNNQKHVISSGISQGYFEDFEEIRKFGEMIALKINSTGPINIQCRKVKNEIIPFEINPRFSASVTLRSSVGHNEPNIFLRYKLFNEIPKKITIKSKLVLKDFTEKEIKLSEIKNLKKYD